MTTEIKPFGLAIQYAGEDSMYAEVYSNLQRQKFWLNVRMDHASHQAFGRETHSGCLACTWPWRFAEFWSTIAYATEVCENCGHPAYVCCATRQAYGY